MDSDDDMVEVPQSPKGGYPQAEDNGDLINQKITMLSTPLFDSYREETYRILKKNINIAQNFPRNIREALHKYTVPKGEGDPLTAEDMEAIDDAFIVMDPLEESIVVFRGIDVNIEGINYDINSIISTSASFDVAEGFRGITCCMFVIHIPIGSKVLFIPEEIHFYGDFEEEILIKGPGKFVRRHPVDDSPLIHLDYILDVSIPLINIFRMQTLKNKIKTIENMNTIAIHLGYELDSIPSDSEDVVGTHLRNDGLRNDGEACKKYFDILMEEFFPYPVEVLSTIDIGENVLPPQPRGPPFSRISIFILFILLYYYPKLYAYFYKDAELSPASTPYEMVKNICNTLKLPSRYVLIRLGAYSISRSIQEEIIINTTGYTQALEFPLPDFSFVEHNIPKYVYLLILDKDISTYQRRLEILRPHISYISQHIRDLNTMERLAPVRSPYLQSLTANLRKIMADLK